MCVTDSDRNSANDIIVYIIMYCLLELNMLCDYLYHYARNRDSERGSDYLLSTSSIIYIIITYIIMLATAIASGSDRESKGGSC